MAEQALWPGQEKVLIFNLEQVTAIASAARSEVFFAFSSDEPMSTTDIARAIGKKPAAVRHHVLDLIEVGLIIKVGTRKKRSRIEDLYVRAGKEVFSQPLPVTDEYLLQMNRGLYAILRQIGRERSSALRLRNVQIDLPIEGSFVTYRSRMTPERAHELGRRMIELIQEFVATPDGEEEILYHVCTFLMPSLGDSRRLHEELTGKPLEMRDESPSP